jgi:hypothetical protein
MEDFWLIVTPRRVKMSQKSAGLPTRVPAENLVRDMLRRLGAARLVHQGMKRVS